MNRRIARRAFLTGLGASVALPFLPSFRSDSGSGILAVPSARADSGAPKRLVIWGNWFGSLHQHWIPKNTSPDGLQWELSEILAPLERFKSKMTVLSGINMISAVMQNRQNGWEEREGGMHSIGNANMLSAAGYEMRYPFSPTDPWFFGRGPSIDQVIAEKLSAPTKFRSLYTGDGSGHPNSVVLDTRGNMVAPLFWPSDVFDTVFGDYHDDPATRERLKAERGTVVDAVLPAYQSLSQKISQRDKLVVDQHLESLFELQRRIQLNTVCVPPPRPEAGVYDPGSDRIIYANPKGPYEDHIDVLAKALACDLTRVATFTIENSRAQPNAILPGYEGIIGGADCHALTHTPYGNADGVEVLKQFCIYNSKLLARFLTILEETTDIDGRSVLDNTCVLNVSEILTGLHDMLPGQHWGYSNPDDGGVPAGTRPVGLPLFYVGGLGGALKTDFHLDCTRDNPYGTNLGKYSHNELYLTVARAMGIDESQMPSFGEAQCCNRLVEEILV